jgi:hypothetical protein
MRDRHLSSLENVRVMIRITAFDGRTYHRVDYRAQSLVRTSASTTANNSASNCTDDTNTGSGDRSASPPMCAGVRVVVLARVHLRKCQSDRNFPNAAVIGTHAWLLFPFTPSSLDVLRRQHQTKRTQGYGPRPIYGRQSSRKMGPLLPDAAADIAGATAFGRASVIRISRSVARRCASVGLCARALCACGKEGPSGTATRGRTGPATQTPKSLASLSWPSRPCRASGQPSCGKRLHRRPDALAVAGSRADTDGGAYKSPEMRIARSDGGTRPSSRFPTNSLQPNGGSTPAEASRLAVISTRGRAGRTGE